jgi:hypothetical protein
MIARRIVLATLLSANAAGAAHAQGMTLSGRQPFTATLSNHTPLAFGMDVSDVSAALRQPLKYVSGSPEEEIYLALRNQGRSGLMNHHDRLYLQFRNGRLAGWKGDYGQNWMWQ